jgi:hypothetical protein
MTTKLVCRGCGGPRHEQGTETVWYYECKGPNNMSELNEFHKQNIARQHEAFAPAHSTDALLVCVGEELGELCAAILGVTGEKKRKAHLKSADVLDACADAATYLSLVIGSLGETDLVLVLTREGPESDIRHRGPIPATVRLQELLGGLCFSYRIGNREAAISYAARLYLGLVNVARRFGCINWQTLLGDTFNMVSERAGSSIKTTLGQP